MGKPQKPQTVPSSFRNRIRWTNTQIIATIITTLGVIIAAYLSYLGIRSQNNSSIANLPTPKSEAAIQITFPQDNDMIQLATEIDSFTFPVQGFISGVSLNTPELHVYSLVRFVSDSQQDWWIQSESFVDKNGSWLATVYSGDLQYPRKQGDVLEVTAVIVNRELSLNTQHVRSLDVLEPIAKSDIIRVTVSEILP